MTRRKAKGADPPKKKGKEFEKGAKGEKGEKGKGKESQFPCGNILYFWLVSEESFWLCAYLDERAEVVQCADSALVGACIFCFGEFSAGIHL